MSKKLWIIFIILIVGAGAFFIATGSKNNDDGGDVQRPDNPLEIVADDHVAGAKDQKIVVMEYFDFQCPGCAGLYSQMQDAKKEFGDQVTFVFRHFPLTNIHPNALAAARAGEAAALQGKFFEMEELLFTTQNTWGNQNTADAQKTFEGYAKQLGLNVAQFKEDYSSGQVLERINRDRDTAAELGVNKTPTVFLNGKKLELNANGDLRKALQQAIKEQKQ